MVLASALGVAGLFFIQTWGKVQENSVDIPQAGGIAPAPPPGIGPMEGGVDLLIVGTDNDATQGDAFGERDATLNDVNIWLHVAADHSTAVAVSLPRDLVIPHPECSDPETGEVFGAMSAQPLNDAFSRGGLGCVVATVQKLTGAPINYAGTISFNGVIALSDAVGGVDVCLTEAIPDPLADLDLPAGINSLSGREALAFLRTRHGVGDGSDLARISVQQSYLSSLLRKVKSNETLSDPATLFRLATVASEQMRLSKSLANLNVMASMALTLKGVDLDKVLFVQYPAVDDPEQKGKVIPDEVRAAQMLEAILSDTAFALGDDSAGNGILAPTTPTQPPATGTPDAPAPPVIDGLKGQPADRETCTRPAE